MQTKTSRRVSDQCSTANWIGSQRDQNGNLASRRTPFDNPGAPTWIRATAIKLQWHTPSP
jgi:hypothetical protein